MIAEFDIQGHRGCRGLMPENTIPAMLHAIDLGVTTLEMDVVITKDKKVILSHEPFFNHEISTQPNGTIILEKEERKFNIYNMTYDSVQQYNVGLAAHPRFTTQQKMSCTKPLLSDVIIAVKNYCKQKNKAIPYFNIETKCLPISDNLYHPAPAIFVDLLMDVIIANQLESKTIIQSFDFRTLQIMHNKHVNIKTAMLIEDTDKRTITQQLEALGFVPTIYSPHYSLVNTELVSFCKAKNMQLIPWTVNDIEKIQTLKSLGVNGLISDYPNLYQQLK